MGNNELQAKILRLEQENKDLKDNNNHLQAIIDDGRAENKRFREENKELKEDLKSQQMTNLKQQEIALDYWNAWEEIRNDIMSNKSVCTECIKIAKRIDEVLNNEA